MQRISPVNKEQAPHGAQRLSVSAALVAAFDDAVLAVDHSGPIIVWNQAVRKCVTDDD